MYTFGNSGDVFTFEQLLEVDKLAPINNEISISALADANEDIGISIFELNNGEINYQTMCEFGTPAAADVIAKESEGIKNKNKRGGPPKPPKLRGNRPMPVYEPKASKKTPTKVPGGISGNPPPFEPPPPLQPLSNAFEDLANTVKMPPARPPTNKMPQAVKAIKKRSVIESRGENVKMWLLGQSALYTATRAPLRRVIPPNDTFQESIGDKLLRLKISEAEEVDIDTGQPMTIGRTNADMPPPAKYYDERLAYTAFPFLKTKNPGSTPANQNKTANWTQDATWLESDTQTMRAILDQSYYARAPREEQSVKEEVDELRASIRHLKRVRRNQPAGSAETAVIRDAKKRVQAATDALTAIEGTDQGRQQNRSDPYIRAIRIFRVDKEERFPWIRTAVRTQAENMGSFCLILRNTTIWSMRAAEVCSFYMAPGLVENIMRKAAGPTGTREGSVANSLYVYTRGRWLAGVCTRRFKHEAPQMQFSIMSKVALHNITARTHNATAYATFLASDPHGLCRREEWPEHERSWSVAIPASLAVGELTFDDQERRELELPDTSLSTTEEYLLGGKYLHACVFPQMLAADIDPLNGLDAKMLQATKLQETAAAAATRAAAAAADAAAAAADVDAFREAAKAAGAGATTTIQSPSTKEQAVSNENVRFFESEVQGAEGEKEETVAMEFEDDPAGAAAATVQDEGEVVDEQAATFQEDIAERRAEGEGSAAPKATKSKRNKGHNTSRKITTEAIGRWYRRTRGRPVPDVFSAQIGFAFDQNIRPIDNGDRPSHFTLWHVLLQHLVALPYMCTGLRTYTYGQDPTNPDASVGYRQAFDDCLEASQNRDDAKSSFDEAVIAEIDAAAGGVASSNVEARRAELIAADDAFVKARRTFTDAYNAYNSIMPVVWNAFVASLWEQRVSMLETGPTRIRLRYSKTTQKMNNKALQDEAEAQRRVAAGGAKQNAKDSAAVEESAAHEDATRAGIEDATIPRGAIEASRNEARGDSKKLQYFGMAPLKDEPFMIARVLDQLRNPASAEEYIFTQYIKHHSIKDAQDKILIGLPVDVWNNPRMRAIIAPSPNRNIDFREAANILREFVLDMLSIHASACDVWRWIPPPKVDIPASYVPASHLVSSLSAEAMYAAVSSTTGKSRAKANEQIENEILKLHRYAQQSGYAETFDDVFFRAAGSTIARATSAEVGRAMEYKPSGSEALAVNVGTQLGWQLMIADKTLPYVYLLADVCAHFYRTARAIVTEVWLEMDRRFAHSRATTTKYADVSHNWLPDISHEWLPDGYRRRPPQPMPEAERIQQQTPADLFRLPEDAMRKGDAQGWSFDVEATFALGLAVVHPAANSFHHNPNMFYPDGTPATIVDNTRKELIAAATYMMRYNGETQARAPEGYRARELERDMDLDTKIRSMYTSRAEDEREAASKDEKSVERALAAMLFASTAHRTALAAGILTGVVRTFILPQQSQTQSQQQAAPVFRAAPGVRMDHVDSIQWAFQDWIPKPAAAREHFALFVIGCKNQHLSVTEDPLFGNGFLQATDMNFEVRDLDATHLARGSRGRFVSCETWITQAISAFDIRANLHDGKIGEFNGERPPRASRGARGARGGANNGGGGGGVAPMEETPATEHAGVVFVAR